MSVDGCQCLMDYSIFMDADANIRYITSKEYRFFDRRVPDIFIWWGLVSPWWPWSTTITRITVKYFDGTVLKVGP